MYNGCSPDAIQSQMRKYSTTMCNTPMPEKNDDMVEHGTVPGVRQKDSLEFYSVDRPPSHRYESLHGSNQDFGEIYDPIKFATANVVCQKTTINMDRVKDFYPAQ